MDDKRFSDLDRKISEVAKDVASIRELLITEPEASPLGRSLLARSHENRAAISELRRDFDQFKRQDFDPIDDWWNQTRGAWRFVLGAGVILGLIGSFFGLLAYFQ